MFDFNGKSVLITGGEPGIGASLALRLSAEGAKVALVARHQEELDGVVKEIRKARRDRLRNRCGRRRQGVYRLWDRRRPSPGR